MSEGTCAQPDINLSFAEPQTQAPLVRLLSAALWRVVKLRDVMQYGVLEKFVTSACETVPGMLTVRHQGKLTLGLRGRLILELCRTQPDAKVIEPHLKRMRAPAAPPSVVRNDVKIDKTVESFHLLVRTLLTDATERELFFKEDFPVDYGPKFDKELEKLLWEFLSRMDQLLSAPNFSETLSWLTDDSVVLEECTCQDRRSQLLNILVRHETLFGHHESAAALPPSTSDSSLDSLSLPPSGKTAADQMTGRETSASCSHAPAGGWFDSPITEQSFPKVPHAKENKKSPRRQHAKDRGEGGAGVSTQEDDRRSGGVKRKHSYTLRNESKEEQKDDWDVSCSKKCLIGKVSQSPRNQVANVSDDDGAQSCSVAAPGNVFHHLVSKSFWPNVVIRKLPVTYLCRSRSKAEPSTPEQQGNTPSPKASRQPNTSGQTEFTDCSSPSSDDKE